ncbi:hypothetical protein [Ferrimicrobium sp.]|uniref:hypothetical protein n=1 Tax=Ferrimicrobium sp. TaxID=2926050 RepID=UPI0026197BBE|nr:hypothetical protein [Ferrimicrobium sp.]
MSEMCTQLRLPGGPTILSFQALTKDVGLDGLDSVLTHPPNIKWSFDVTVMPSTGSRDDGCMTYLVEAIIPREDFGKGEVRKQLITRTKQR